MGALWADAKTRYSSDFFQGAKNSAPDDNNSALPKIEFVPYILKLKFDNFLNKLLYTSYTLYIPFSKYIQKFTF